MSGAVAGVLIIAANTVRPSLRARSACLRIVSAFTSRINPMEGTLSDRADDRAAFRTVWDGCVDLCRGHRRVTQKFLNRA